MPENRSPAILVEALLKYPGRIIREESQKNDH